MQMIKLGSLRRPLPVLVFAGALAVSGAPAQAAKIPLFIFFGSPTAFALSLLACAAIWIIVSLVNSHNEAKAEKAKPIIELALSLHRERKFAEAIIQYDLAISALPKAHGLWSLRGQAQHNLGNYDIAIRDFSDTILAVPKDPDPLFRRAMVFMDKKNFEAAISDLTRVIKLGASTGPTLYFRGVAYAGQGDDVRAIKDFSQALVALPDAVYVLIERAAAFERTGAAENATADRARAAVLKVAADAKAAAQAAAPVAPVYVPAQQPVVRQDDLTSVLARMAEEKVNPSATLKPLRALAVATVAAGVGVSAYGLYLSNEIWSFDAAAVETVATISAPGFSRDGSGREQLPYTATLSWKDKSGAIHTRPQFAMPTLDMIARLGNGSVLKADTIKIRYTEPAPDSFVELVDQKSNWRRTASQFCIGGGVLLVTGLFFLLLLRNPKRANDSAVVAGRAA